MSHLPTIYRGENRIFARTLFLADGVTSLPVANLAGARVILMQGGRAVTGGEFILGTDDEIREGSAANVLEYEMTSTVSSALKPGTLSLRWTLLVTDAEFTEEAGGTFIDVTIEEVATIAR